MCIKTEVDSILRIIKGRIISVLNKMFPNYMAKRLLKKDDFYKVTIWGGGSLSMMIEEGFKTFLEIKEYNDEALKNRLRVDIVKCYLQYGLNPVEYFLHGFRNMPDSKRKTYIPNMVKDQLIIKKLGKNCYRAFTELKSKHEFYKLAGNYFHRDIIYISGKQDYDVFEDFVNLHSKFIAKPCKGSCGSNIGIHDIADYDGNTQNLFNALLEVTDEWVIEELIVQDSRMAEWNSSSVNTIRIPSFRTKEGIKVLTPFLRVGRSGSVVDNAGGGGIYASVDSQTGKICSSAMDERGNVYESNPDNGKSFYGWQCPKWNELIKLSEEVHNSLPSYHKYVGFDFALSKEAGWVLVEGNWGDFICQQSSLKKGLKKEFVTLLNS